MVRNPAHENQYRIAREAAGLASRPEQGLLCVTGGDRTAWLNNLVTNVVKTLQPGEGNYAFGCNAKGRTVFDGNVLVDKECIWLDVDRRRLDAAKKHLERFIITEDVALSDRTKEFERLALLGPAAHEIVARMGLGQLTAMAPLQHSAFHWEGQSGRLVRHDFAGLPAAELWIAPPASAALVAALLDAGRPSGLARVEPIVLETLRIEAGIPATVPDIDEEVIPPETGQIERGISYHKGCYLGQEVIERMRSHGVLANRLAGVRVEGEDPPPTPCPLKSGESAVGRLTSACWSYALGSVLGLAYVKTALAVPGQALTVDTPGGARRGEVVALPVRAEPAG